MANQPVDLFQVALGMDPRFGENMPQDVADAFANGDVARVFRTSADLSPKSIPSGSVPMASQAGRIDGDYGGSIYVQNRSGKTARWKQSGDEDYGWNANKGQGSFYDNAVRVDTDSFDSSVDGLMRSGTPGAQARATVAEKMGTPLASSSAQDMLGEKLVEYQYKDNGKRVSAHPGHEITDVVESTGERHYLKGDLSNPRGVKSVEPVSDFMGRRGIQTPAMEARDKGDALAAAGRKTTREEVKDTVVDSLLRDENHPDPAKAEFNKRWNEQVRKDSASTGNKANPFEEMSGRAIEDEMYSEVTSSNGDALAQKTVEDKQEEVQQDLQESAEEKGAETLQDALKEKAQEKAEEIAKDKAKEVVKEVNDVDGGKVKETPKSGVRVRKASTTCFYYPNCFNFFCW